MKIGIPKGDYCHDSKGNTCVYWSLRDLPPQENGHCFLVGKSDWDVNEEYGRVEVRTYNTDHSIKLVTMEDTHKYHVSMIWDKLKECSGG